MLTTVPKVLIECVNMRNATDAARLVRHPLPRSADPVVIGFREQTSAVSVGIDALIQRAIDEGTDLILEGAHLVPGFLEYSRFKGKAVVVPLPGRTLAPHAQIGSAA